MSEDKISEKATMELPQHVEEPFIMNRYDDIVITGLKQDIDYIKYVSTCTCVACYIHICASIGVIFL